MHSEPVATEQLAEAAARVVPANLRPRADLSNVLGFPPTAPWRTSCAKCALKGTCFASALNASEAVAFTELTRTKRSVTRGSLLVSAGEAFNAIYIVHTGALKERVTSRDGKDKITAFFLPSDIIGLDAISAGVHRYEVTALEDSEVCVAPFEDLQRLMQASSALRDYLIRALSADISRDQGLMLLMGGMSAEQRLSAFLLSFAERHRRLGYPQDRLRLRMSRQEIANYIGLTLETVCRLMSRFQREGLIDKEQRALQITDREGLQSLLA